VISEKEFTKVLIPPLRGEFDLGKFFSGNHLRTDMDKHRLTLKIIG